MELIFGLAFSLARFGSAYLAWFGSSFNVRRVSLIVLSLVATHSIVPAYARLIPMLTTGETGPYSPLALWVDWGIDNLVFAFALFMWARLYRYRN